ncbi:ATP-binding protein [Ruminococcus flavefaciens]|uniref:ATP-binding protein n=1 Tax=Ruminococcus flavefaciens TaxID=1265 RepID=UPI0004919246|nr:AAA family ATPase [Ruminococcus flavefaciens]
MKRKMYDYLVEWKKRTNGTSALLVQGARRVGKSYIVEEFAKAEYKSYILIDFNKADEAVKDIFLHDLDNMDILFQKLSTLYNKKLYPRESLIIFDEVQLFPRARSAIKYLVEDGRYDYIETGSFISIRKNVEGILIPSEEDTVNMYPMDFEEFLWALDNDTMYPLIVECFNNRKPLGQALHRKAMDLFRLYLIVGGMPQAVKTYADTKDFDSVDTVKRRILKLYREDIRKHAIGYEMKVEAIFDEIPSQLQNHNQHFKLSSLEKGARFDNYRDAMFWLSDAMIVNNCYNSTEPNIGLNLNRDRTLLKCYMGDTGLLISHCFDEKGIVSEEIYKKLLLGKLEVDLGMIMENIVAQMFTASGHKLFFYANSSRDDAEARMEIDFLIAKSKISNRHNISPIEVKSGKNYTLSSLKKFIRRYNQQLHTPYVLHTSDLKVEDDIVYLPLYMTSLL